MSECCSKIRALGLNCAILLDSKMIMCLLQRLTKLRGILGQGVQGSGPPATTRLTYNFLYKSDEIFMGLIPRLLLELLRKNARCVLDPVDNN